METTKNYNTIDIGKFIACIGIVALHVSPLSSLCHCVFLHSTLGFLTSLCVPYFFVISAFLFFSRNPEYSLNKLLHFVKRITILYLGWLLIYIIVTCITNCLQIFRLLNYLTPFMALGSM